jgi:nitrite reductase (NO-forming)
MLKSFKLLSPILISVTLFSCGVNSTPTSQNNSKTPESGEAIYKRTCLVCHQPNGEGVPGTFPPLAKSDFLIDRENTISQVINGKMGELTVNGVKYNNIMPPQILNDDEIAAVLTYVYANFGNTGKPVTADDVKTIRAKHK